MALWYSAGTVTVTNNNSNVVGAGTDFLANARPGDLFQGPNGKFYEIADVPAEGQLRLAVLYDGVTAKGAGYAIVPSLSSEQGRFALNTGSTDGGSGTESPTVWYAMGTISVVYGSTAVTGVGAKFLRGARPGDVLRAPDGKYYQIAEVTSDTRLVLAKPYAGASQVNQLYAIAPSITSAAGRAAQNAGGSTGTDDSGVTSLTVAVQEMVNQVGVMKNSWDAGVTPNMATAVPPALAGTGSIGASKRSAREDHTHPMPTRSQLGLGLVDNTPDALKPVSEAQRAAIDERMPNDLANVAQTAALAETDTLPINQANTLRRATIGQIIARMLARANTWAAVQIFSMPFKPAAYTKSSMPSPNTYADHVILVTDAAGGRTLCVSDGTAWKIMGTTTTVS